MTDSISQDEGLTLGEALKRAVLLQQQGNLSAAEQLLLAILKAKPDQPDARQFLAVLRHQQGRSDEAIALFAETLRVHPRRPQTWVIFGCILHERGDRAQALACFENALAIDPNHAQGLYNQGKALKESGRPAEALASYDRLLALAPGNADGHFSRGNVLAELKRFDEALQSYDHALALRPQHIESITNRGSMLQALKRLPEALESLDRALTLHPRNAETLAKRAAVLAALSRFTEASADYEAALALRPDNAAILNGLGNTLASVGQYEEAIATYDRALAARPHYAEAHNNKGSALKRRDRFDEALASFEQALGIAPDYAEAHFNRGVTLADLMRFDEALACYGKALAVRPDYAEAHFNEATLRLLLGDYRGWEKYEWRKREQIANSQQAFPQPVWSGNEPLEGKTILLHAEQGMGDTIQFARYAPLVAAKGGRAVLRVPRALQSLMRTLAGAPEVVSRDDPLPAFDVHCSLLSLPLAFGTDAATIPATVPYVSALPDRVIDWSERLELAMAGDVRVGLAWSGNAAHKNDRNRSIAFDRLAPALDVAGVKFVVLQTDLRAGDADAIRDHPNVMHFGDAHRDFADTAALIATLDLVISVDTAVAHLAGALGKPVWVLLPLMPDWRWMIGRDDSPWYPTARLFRQEARGDWGGVIAPVATELALFPSKSANKP